MVSSPAGRLRIRTLPMTKGHPAVLDGAYDVEKVRADFPALALEVHGHPLTYLDNAASAQKPVQVLERMRHAYEAEYSNVHRGLHYLANAMTEAFEGARESARRFLNAGFAGRDHLHPLRHRLHQSGGELARAVHRGGG